MICKSLRELLDVRLQRMPERVFLKEEHSSYTWSDVETASQIIAADLRSLGVKAGTHVGLCGLNSVNWILTFFALQKLGAMAMLMNPKQTPEEIGKVCALGDITVLCHGEIPGFTGASLQSGGTQAGGMYTERQENSGSRENAAFRTEAGERKAFLSAVRSAGGCRLQGSYYIGREIDYRKRAGEYDALKNRFRTRIDPDAPGVVLFTSGSTGHPKGVILSAYNLVNAASAQVDLMHMTGDDRELLIVPLFHILGLVVCLYPCMLTGAALVIPDDVHSATLIRMLRKEGCTLMHAVPTMILAILSGRVNDPEAMRALRCVCLAGSAATKEQLTLFCEKMPDTHFMNAYGLSEMAPVSVTAYDEDREHLLNTVGKPVRNILIRIVDPESGRLCAAGEAGEILVRGFNLMVGYYKLPIEEQQIDEDGYLHTGDMGMLDSEGYLILLGRYKELIIRGGENIAPAEVENALAALDVISQVKVVGISSAFYGEEAAACILLKDGAVWDEERAREHLGKRLAKYKIPSWFLICETFPVLGSGKTDVSALRRYAADRVRDMKKKKELQ